MSFNPLALTLACALLLSGLSVVVQADYAAPAASATESDPNYIAAKKAVAAKDWNTALSRLKAVKPDADVYNLQGFSYRNLGNYSEAFRHYDLALKADPNHRGAHEYVGEAYLRTNNLPMAEQHLSALERICGKGCEEYQDLARSIAAFKKKR